MTHRRMIFQLKGFYPNPCIEMIIPCMSSETLNSDFMEIQKGSLMGRVNNEIGAEFLVGTGGYKLVTLDSAGDSVSQWFGFGDKVV